MLKISVQSKGILDREFLSLESGFQSIKEAGFDGIDLNLDVFLKNTELYQGKANSFFSKNIDVLTTYFEPYKVECRKNNLCFFQMHAPYPVWVLGKEEQNRYMAEQVIPKSIELAGFLGIPYVVIHPIKLQYVYGYREERRRNLAYFENLIPLAKEHKVTICMENLYESMGGRIVEGVCARPEEAVWYLDRLNERAGEEVFGFCLDTGHLNLIQGNPAQMVRQLGERIKILHLHENDGNDDLHQLPFTFGGIEGSGFQWEELLSALRETGYQGVLNFETFPSMNSFPEGVQEKVLETIATIGRYFSNRIENG